MYCRKHSIERPRPRLKSGVSLCDASFEKECRIDRILYKYTHNLPLEQWQIKRSAAVYADITDMPKDPAEMREFMERKRSIWEELPAEIRRAYHDDMWQMMADAASNPVALKEKIEGALINAKKIFKGQPVLEKIEENKHAAETPVEKKEQ